MSLSYISAGGVVALGYDPVTGERGLLCKLINRTCELLAATDTD